MPAKSSTELELDRALSKHEVIFRRIQLCYDDGQASKADSTNSKKLENFKIRYSTFSKTKVEYHYLIQQIVILNQKLTPEATPSYQFLESIEELCDHIEYLAMSFIKNETVVSSPSECSHPSQNRSSIHLPKIELMKFDGEDLTLWPLFYENFQQLAHIKTELTQAEKLKYLLSSLTGKALKTSSGLEPTPGNYTLIWKLLEDTYQDQRYQANLYLDRLFSFRPRYNSNHNQLQIFLGKFHTSVVALKRLKLEDLTDYILTYFSMTKLPSETVQAFELIRDHTQDYPPTKN